MLSMCSHCDRRLHDDVTIKDRTIRCLDGLEEWEKIPRKAKQRELFSIEEGSEVLGFTLELSQSLTFTSSGEDFPVHSRKDVELRRNYLKKLLDEKTSRPEGNQVQSDDVGDSLFGVLDGCKLPAHHQSSDEATIVLPLSVGAPEVEQIAFKQTVDDNNNSYMKHSPGIVPYHSKKKNRARNSEDFALILGKL